MTMSKINGITLKTINHREYGQDISVCITLENGQELEVIRSFGALPDVSIHHHVTGIGIEAGMLAVRKAGA